MYERNGLKFGKSRRKLNENQVLEIFNLKNKKNVHELMKQYNISSPSIYRIFNKQTYKEILK